MQLKDTLNLPQTSFPMRASLTTREPARLAHWEKMGLYQRIQTKNAAKPAFVLHDGPPFTNGDVHIGTALNKLLKDMVLRYKTERGHRTPYVPGWDCHGLPIEVKAMKEAREKNKFSSPGAADIRQECVNYSRRYIKTQRKQFQRLGILADWITPYFSEDAAGNDTIADETGNSKEYRTMDPGYEAAELRAFAEFVEKKLVYRALKPVLYSIPYETALAEAEIEYKDHVSPSIYVKFPVPIEEARKFGLPTDKPLFVVIWTTTPWTLPANLAIAVHPKLEYVVFKRNPIPQDNFEGEYLIVAEARLQDFLKTTKLLEVHLKVENGPAQISDISNDPEIMAKLSVLKIAGAKLEYLQPRHPFIERASPIVLAEYVTTDTGTGCVHTAPGHGLDDYHTGLKYKLPIYCPLDHKARYILKDKIPRDQQPDGEIPAELEGITVLETKGKCPANDKVIEILKQKNALVSNPIAYPHQYPHCWRSKTPVIFMAMYQWFIALDKPFIDNKKQRQSSLRELAKTSISTVRWVPASGENRIRGAVETRPDWCISRQRVWGVPIPAFYGPNGEVYIDAAVIRSIADKIENEGILSWFVKETDTLLKDISVPSDWVKPLTHGKDTLDVWLDSGTSHYAVLKKNKDLTWPADLYLEGSDQHRGWFQSSLWTALATDAAPPYRAVLTHGFVVDEGGRKISKSDGKPQTADDYVKKYGADLIRFWIASEDFRHDITLSENIFTHVSNAYRNLRNTFCFLLGNLADFDPTRHAVGPEHFTALDKWALNKFHVLSDEVTAHFDAYDFHLGVKAIDNFVSVTLSRQYHDILKDRLYTFAPDWPERRAAQTAMYAILRGLLGLLAPMLPFTTDEAWSHLAAGNDFTEDSIHLQPWPEPDAAWASPTFVQAAADIETILKFRERIYEKLEVLRQEKKIGKSLDAQVILTGSAEPMPLLRRYADDLPEMFIVSQVHLNDGPAEAIDIAVDPASGIRCPRSWRWVPELVAVEGFDEKVSPRDRAALLAKYAPQKT